MVVAHATSLSVIVPTSIGIITITATAGSLTYMPTGGGQPGLPPGSVGYVHVAAGVAMVLGAVLSVGRGARLNQKMKPRALALVFATVFVVIGVRLVFTNFAALLSSFVPVAVAAAM